MSSRRADRIRRHAGAAADFGPTFGEPEAGDEIVAEGVVFEVMPGGADKPDNVVEGYATVVKKLTLEHR